MRKSTFLKLVILILSITIGSTKVSSQLLEENFNYAVGENLAANGWNITNASTGALITTSPSSISYPGYLSSGIGNEITIAAVGQDLNKTFTSPGFGNVYVSCLVNINTATLAGDYFLHLGPTAMGTTFHGKVFVKMDASNKLAFGISKNGAITSAVFTPFSYSLNTTYLLVLRFTIVSGAANDYASIYINPTLNAREPASGWTQSTDNTAADLANIGSVALRQGSSTSSPTLKLDGIRVSTTWADIVGATYTGIKTSTNQLSGLDYIQNGGPSALQSFTVEGMGLTDNVTVAAPTNYEISTTGDANFSPVSQITLNQINGEVAKNTVYVRLKAGLTAASYNENITISSTGVTSQNVGLSGTVSAPAPSISTNNISLTGFNYILSKGPSTEQSFTVSGANLTNNIDITAPVNYEISTTSGGGFVAQSPISLTQNSGIIAPTTIYVRLKAGLSVNSYNDNLTLSSTGASDKSISLNGSVSAPPPPTLNVSVTELQGFNYVIGNGPSAEQSFTVSGVNLTNDIVIGGSTNYEISITTGVGFIAQSLVTLTPTDGSIALTTIYVRLKSGLGENMFSENLTVSTTGASSKTIALSGYAINSSTTKIVNEATAGTLVSLLTDQEKTTVTRLIVTGNFNWTEIKTLKQNLTALTELDLSGASVSGNTLPTSGLSNASSLILDKLILPSNLTSIGTSAFSGCTGLKNVIVGNSVTSIGTSAFSSCTGLTSVTFGSSVTTYSTPFYNCTNLKTIIIKRTIPSTINSNTFYGVNPKAVIVPTGCTAAYKAATGWNSFNIIEVGPSSSTPTINGLIYAPNSGPSDIKPFKVSGGLLTGDIIVTAPENFEISTKSGVEFSPTNAITITPVDGIVVDSVLYVRLKAGLSVNTYSGNISLASAGFTTQNIALNGAVRTTPETINVITAGTLSSLLTASEKAAIVKLTITGNIDARDFKCMREEMPLLANLNLKDANIMAYSGLDGTDDYWQSTTYPANELPQFAFVAHYNGIVKTSLLKVILPTSLTSIGEYSLSVGGNLKTIICLNPTPPTFVNNNSVWNVSPTAVYVPIGKVAIYKAATGWSTFNIVEYKLKTTTTSVSSIKLTEAKLTGSLDVITDSPVTAHGFCWNTTGTPTITDNKVDNGAISTEGTYSNTINNLSGATTYYVRAFATDGTSGTVYSNEISFVTAEIPATSSISGNFYNSQYWPKSKSPYTISGNVNLAEGTTLTIEPGVVVNFAGNYEIMTMGNIVANGLVNDSITFNANSNVCTFLDFKNAKLGDSELNFISMNGYKQFNPQYLSSYSTALKSQGTCSDSLLLSNSRIKTSEIYFQKTVILKKSNIEDLIGGYSRIIMDSCQINTLGFGMSMNSVSSNIFSGNLNFILLNSKAKGISLVGNFNSSYFEILNTKVTSSDLGNVTGKIQKSRLTNVQYLSDQYSYSNLNVDSTIFLNSKLQISSSNNSFNYCIFKTDSTQTLNLNGTITKSQFIGNNNKLGGVGLDAVTGTITNSSIVNHRIGLQTSALTINNSNFINNSQYAIKNTGATNIDAKSNFWGVGNTTTATVKAKIWDYYNDMNLGKVLYDNYLTTPNADAPITPPQNFRKEKAAVGINYTWNVNPESDIKGYKLYYGKFDGFTFENSMDLGNVTNYNLPTASINDTVLVTAYDLQADNKDDMLEGHESWYAEDTPFPSAAGIISGNATVCQGQAGVTYSVPAIANATSYRWTLPTGASGTSKTPTISVDYSLAAVSGKITVRGVNEYGEGDSSFVAIAVNLKPVKPAPITGSTLVCAGEKSIVYSVPEVQGAKSYVWTLPNRVYGTSTTNSITVDFGEADSSYIAVAAVNDCGAGDTTQLFINIKPLPDNGTAINVDLSTGLVAYYPFNGNANDASGNNNNASQVLGGVSYVPGVSGQAVKFGGYNNQGQIKVPNSPSLQFSNEATFAYWLRLDNAAGMDGYGRNVPYGNHCVFAKSADWAGIYNNTGISSATQKLYSGLGSAGSNNSIGTKAKGVDDYTVGGWIHVAYVISPSGNSVYINGVKDSTMNQTFNLSGSNSQDLYFGKYSNTWYPLNGTLDEFRIYNKALNDNQIYALSLGINSIYTANQIVGSTSVCAGEKGIVYKVPAMKYAKTYEWTLPGGATGSSTSDSILVDYSNTAASGDISVKGINDCGYSGASKLAVIVKPLLGSIGTISGNTTVCAGTKAQIYSIAAVENAKSYVWTLPNGYFGTSLTNSISIDFTNIAKSGDISVKAINDCGESPVSKISIIVNANPIANLQDWNTRLTGQESMITEISTVNDSVLWVMDQLRKSISVTTDGGKNWEINQFPDVTNNMYGGFSAVNDSTAYLIISGGNKGIFKTINKGKSWEKQNSGFGANSFPDIVHFYNSTEGVAIGDGNTSQLEVYTTNNAGLDWVKTPLTNFPDSKSNWLYNSSEYYRIHHDTIFVKTAKGIYKSIDKGHYWTLVNSSEGIISFDFKNEKNGLIILSNKTVVRTEDGGTTTYSVTTPTGIDTFSKMFYNESAGAFLLSMGNNILISKDFGHTWSKHETFSNRGASKISTCPSGKTVIGGWGQLFIAKDEINFPTSKKVIEGNDTVCAGSKSVLYSVPAVNNATSYSWTLPSGANGSSTTNSIAIDFSDLAVSGDISVKAANDCKEIWIATQPITVKPLIGTIGTINGNASVCANTKAEVYSVAQVANAKSYIWTLPNGMTGTSVTNSISVDFAKNARSGKIWVRAENDCNSTDSVSINITVKPVVGIIGTITGESSVCAGSKAVVYSIPTVDNAGKYIWTLPNGMTGTSETNSISVDFANNATSGRIWVRAENDCNSTDSVSINVKVKPLIGRIGEITGYNAVCEGSKAITYTVPEVENAISYEWTMPTGVTGTSTTNSITVDFGTAAESGYIKVKAINDCDETDYASFAIAIKHPTASNSNAKVCSKELPYVWNSSNYNETGIYTKTFVNAAGCDSVATLDLTVLLETASTTKAKVCSKELPYVWNSSNYNATGIYTKTFVNAAGCDSVATLDLTVLLETASTTKAKVCEKELPFVWNGSNYNATGIYTKTFVNTAGCDSVATLDLTVLLESESTNKAKVCEKELPYVWNGINYNSTGIYTKTFVNAVGCDSIATLDLVVIATPETPLITRTDYTLKSSSMDGNQWYNSLGAINGAVNQDYVVTANEEYYVIVTKNGCSSDPSNKIRVDNTAVSNISTIGSVKIYPNPVKNELRLEYDGETHFEIVNLIGQVLYNGRLIKTALVETSHLFPGVYLIRFTEGKTVSIQKFIKE